MHFHQVIHQFLLDYREKNDSSFRFLVRQRASLKDKKYPGGKFAHGMVFQGTQDYCFVGLVDRSGGVNATRSVGIVVKPYSDGFKANLEIVFPGEEDQQLIRFYRSLADQFEGAKWDPKNTRAYIDIGEFPDDDPTILYKWLSDNYSIIQNEAEKSGIVNLIPDEQRFRELQHNLDQKLKEANTPVNYWIFQGNPDIYNITNALKAAHLKSWKVAAHKDKISRGDKVILWQTGKAAGCYALAEVTSEVGFVDEENYEKQYYKDDTNVKPTERVEIKILKYLADHPILWSDIKHLPEFSNFNAGNQGTNFTATQEEYEFFEEFISSNSPTADEQRLLETLRIHPKNRVKEYFELLDYFIEANGIDKDDLRFTFNITDRKVRLIAGQRVIWDLDGTKNSLGLDIIADEEWAPVVYKYENEKEIFMVTLKTIKDIPLLRKQTATDLVISSLNNISKSGYRRHLNTAFLKAAYDKQYRKSIFDQLKINTDMSTVNTFPLNQILYGPPGTGKTYETAALALEIIYGEEYVSSLSRKQIQQQYSELTITDWNNDSGRIAFCTFHQSFSYEDFVEGIKPSLLNERVIYEKEPGVFKRIADLAKQTVTTDNFETAYEKFVTDVQEDQNFELKTPVQGRPFKVEINSNHSSVAIPKTETATRMSVTKTMVKDYVTTGKIHDWKPYTTAIGDYLKENYKFEVKSKEKEPYILIIDEINRGNVASIFGELITLIEMDKREGAENELSVILPYSKTKFSVPDNLHIIGTMNTADRSVEALDSALRRRFEFVEMMPDSRVIDDVLNNRKFNGFKISEILDTINERITLLIDRDHQIGHSYFLKLREGENLNVDLRAVFQNKIIPLLQEYFFNDYVKIAMVIGEGFLSKKDSSKIVFAKADGDYESDYNDRTIYEIASNFNLSTAIDLLMFKGNEAK